MTLLSFCSAKSSPGVSTLAVALAHLRSAARPTVVVEADADGGVAAARLGLSYEPGFADLSAAFRRDIPDATNTPPPPNASAPPSPTPTNSLPPKPA